MVNGAGDKQNTGNVGKIEEPCALIGIGNTDHPGRIVRQSNDFARNKLNIHDLMAVRILACLASVVREDDLDFR
jgi:hypothetical protein